MCSAADLALGAVEVDHLDAVVVGVHPVEDPLGDVQTQAVGPQHRFTAQEHVPVGTVHPSPLDSTPLALLGVFLPVRPVHPPDEAKSPGVSTTTEGWSAGRIHVLS